MDISLLAASDHGAHAVEPWITYLFTGLLGAMVVCLALEAVSYTHLTLPTILLV